MTSPPMPFAHAGHATAPPIAPAEPALKLLVKGFTDTERLLLEGTVKLSQRRRPRLDLLPETAAEAADVVMIDSRDASAMAWARSQRGLERKAVIWVDALNVPPGHTAAKRPVQWPILPMLLARALEQGPKKATDAARASERPIAEQAKPKALPWPPTAPHVLVVDDSLAVRGHLRPLLESLGLRVSEAGNGEAGFIAAAAERFNCILMDVLMPGIDGYEACRRIKASARSGTAPAIVMLTSKSSPFDRIRGKMAGCDAYLTKPVDPRQLQQVLSSYAAAPPQQEAPRRAAL